MLIFMTSSIIGLVTILCAVPLLLMLGVFSIVGLAASLSKVDMVGIAFSLVGMLWCWAGFTGLLGYWGWVGLYNRELGEKDLEELKAIKNRGIWGVLAFLPISPAFTWFVIPIFCFIIAIFLDIRNKMDSIEHQHKSEN